MMKDNVIKVIGSTLIVVFAFLTVPSLAAKLPGAIFTTDPAGAIVNANVQYTDKREVYLDGGPGPNAPQTAAGLPDGCYVFQVTDPPGKALLSEDPSKCRVVRVGEGIIQELVKPTTFDGTCGVPDLSDTYYVSSGNGKNASGTEVACHIQDEPDGIAGERGKHDTNTDTDHGGADAIVVQLMPFLDTPNPGGVYKAWMMPIDRYVDNGGDLNEPQGKVNKVRGKETGFDRDTGFGPARDQVKTDNFKVKRQGPPFDSPELTVKKFHDENINCVKDENEVFIMGWPISVLDPLIMQVGGFTDLMIIAEPAGTYVVDESGGLIAGVNMQTVSFLDGGVDSSFCNGGANPVVNVEVAGTSGETHEVVYGNVGIGSIKICKSYGDAMLTAINGWQIQLTGGPLDVDITQITVNGCTTFADLLPGNYKLTELIADTGDPMTMWVPLTPTMIDPVTITSSLTMMDSSIAGSNEQPGDFVNICQKKGNADFDTKGYWHNKNGLEELGGADIDYANSLDPYDSPTSYFNAGDEPFDGQFTNGNPVAEAPCEACTGEGPEDSAKAEVSHFLVEPIAGEDCKQLAQQLLAFTFNFRNRLDGDPNAMIDVGGGNFVKVTDIIDDAISVWQSGNNCSATSTIIDGFNNNDSIPFTITLPAGSCAVLYP